MSDSDDKKLAQEVKEALEASQKSNEELRTKVAELETSNKSAEEKQAEMEKTLAENAETIKALDEAVKEAKVAATKAEIRDNIGDITAKELAGYNAARAEKNLEPLTVEQVVDQTKAFDALFADGAAKEYHDKHGSEGMKEQLSLYKKALAGGATDGGVLVPPAFAMEVENVARDMNEFTQHARTIRTSIGRVQRILQSRSSIGWSADDVNKRAGDGSPSSIKSDVNVHNLLSVQEVAMGLFEDAGFSLSEYLTSPVSMDFAIGEEEAFLGDGTTAGQGRGDGNDEPTSIYSDSANFGTAVPTFAATGYLGRFRELLSGQANALFGTNGAGVEKLLEVTGLISTRYRRNSRFFMSPTTLALARAQKGSDGHFIVQDQVQKDGLETRLFGYPVSLCETMPSAADGAFPIMFGSAYDAYTIARARGLMMEVDRTSGFPARRFLFSSRVGGAPFNPEAMIFIKSDDS